MTTKIDLPERPQNHHTPMMKQYLQIKAEHQDAILFYRLGDFYEMFFEDAIEASKLLDLTLTARNKKEEVPIPLCGIPYHAAENYIAKLIEHGKKIVICEQIGDPKTTKGLLKREVTRTITPGTIIEEKCLESKTNNYLLCVYPQAEKFFCALCDITTGQLEYFTLADPEKVYDEILRLQIKEIIYPESSASDDFLERITKNKLQNLFHHAVSDLFFDLNFAEDSLCSQYKIANKEILNLVDQDGVVPVLGGLLGYLKESKILAIHLLSQPILKRIGDTLFLDETTAGHLELFQTQHSRTKHGTLLWHLDHCASPMGSRLMAQWIQSPLQNQKQIAMRLEAVDNFFYHKDLLDDCLKTLNGLPDLERLANRFVMQSANPRDAIALSQGLLITKQLQNDLKDVTDPLLQELTHKIEDFSALDALINKTMVCDPPLQIKDGGVIRPHINSELDELRSLEKNGKKYILDLEAKEKQATGISSLKIRFNNIFGYYIEVTHTHKDKIPNHYIRKQTLTNAERYITEELKDYESKVLSAAERIKIIEQEIFVRLCAQIAEQAMAIKKTAQAVATLDVLMTFAKISQKFKYHKPQITTEVFLDLQGARHPILERLQPGEPFVPNDITLDKQNGFEMIITGPNMAGKSTILRMTALITIMAQLGCFVPCESATIGICDRIFTRVGAHDHLQKGLSTFMVEMVETAKILREATSRSLILLDEIGRGTSTFDGLALAWAIAEDIHDRILARTLFATHYHELCDLAEQKRGLKNFHMAVKEWNHEIIFLRKLKPGGTNRSYGVVVAGMAGLPPSVIERAKAVLKILEIKDLSFQDQVNQKSTQQSLPFENENPVITEIKNLDLTQLTPLEALNFLANLQKAL